MAEQVVGRYEMLWDCEYCDTAGLLGLSHRHCPNCGAAQDPQRRYYPDEEHKIAVEDHPYFGSDKVCASCDAPASANTLHCGNCGASMEEGSDVRRRHGQSQNADGGFERDGVDRANGESRGAAAAPAAPARKKRWPYVVGAIAAVVIVLVVIATWRRSARITVSAVSWKRSIAIEKLENVRESAWRDKLPATAINPRCSREKRSTKKVEDGEVCTKKRRDKGDGTFEEVEQCKPKYRSEPVYDDKCTYTATKWQSGRTLDSQGQGHSPAPSWPDVALARTGNQVGAEREGKRTETYVVSLSDSKGENHECTFSNMQRWQAFSVGSKWKGELRVIGGGLACDTLKQAR